MENPSDSKITLNEKLKMQFEELDIAKRNLVEGVDKNILAVEEDIYENRSFYEKMRNHGIRRFDVLFNIVLNSSIVSADLVLLSSQIRLSNRRFEKVLYARMLAMIVIEFLNDISTPLGRDLVRELKQNNYIEHVEAINNINKEFAEIRKKHQSVLTSIRNNIAAHKTKDGLNLINQIFSLDPNDIVALTIDVMNVNTKLNKETTAIYYLMLEEAKLKKANDPNFKPESK